MDVLDQGAEVGEAAGFAERIKAETDAAHRATEQSRFVGDLLAGKLTSAGYAALLAQTYFVYETLERAAEVHANDPLAAPFIAPELIRLPSLAADLQFLLGEQWRAQLSATPATARYVARLEEVAFTSPAAFVAHHYLRYLGDLSGGQIIRRMLERAYGYDVDGLRFYIFDEIAKPKVFKDEYRAKLDAAPLTADEQARFIDEVNLAYGLNGALFADLEADIDRYLVK
ncbi:biliverdin-producing heme oxygenase [Rhodococcus sp. SGAir0479]|uniref:biliverdin-producing heme oxygenase n=1 Tax=Rhodococcus sp. SGAir0479 TaxID=2567884 RepID=UPI0010CCE9F0|nr:biliverdin-producing heme oxygenase [Rhodococcus sp. SGAir0479]QCQ91047.1 biliverdin-producing heme oxygenase [Rhodococcus sp. SGAir0479]